MSDELCHEILLSKSIPFLASIMIASMVSTYTVSKEITDLNEFQLRGLIEDPLADLPDVLLVDEQASKRNDLHWYLRGDIGFSYNLAGTATLKQPVTLRGSITRFDRARLRGLRNASGLNVGIGIGYRFTNNLRFDVTLDYIAKSKLKGTNPLARSATSCGTVISGHKKNWLGLINGYHDFKITNKFNPYLGVGGGIARNELSLTRCLTKTHTSKSIWRLSGVIMAGNMIDIYDNLKFDVGYRYLYLGSFKNARFTKRPIAAPGQRSKARLTAIKNQAHQFRIGFHYLLK